MQSRLTWNQQYSEMNPLEKTGMCIWKIVLQTWAFASRLADIRTNTLSPTRNPGSRAWRSRWVFCCTCSLANFHEAEGPGKPLACMGPHQLYHQVAVEIARHLQLLSWGNSYLHTYWEPLLVYWKVFYTVCESTNTTWAFCRYTYKHCTLSWSYFQEWNN